MTYIVNWIEDFEQKTMSAQQAVVNHVKSGDRVFVGGLTVAANTVQALLTAVKAGGLTGIVLHGNMILNQLAVTAPEFTEDRFRYRCFFAGPLERTGIKAGSVSYVPLQFGNYGRYLEHVAPDVTIVPMTPPDENGCCNIGPMGFSPAAIKNSKKVIAQICEGMPRVCGSAHDYHVRDIAAFTFSDETLAVLQSAPASAEEKRIAEYIVDQVPDGACIQLGIGGMANAVGYGLRGKKHLGVHSEMHTESMAALQAEGVIDNSRKSLLPGRSVVGFALGTTGQYNYITNNPDVYFIPFEDVINIHNISANDNMISINTAISIDLTGQVCAESIGHQQYSGTGGQVDFIRGANLSKGGKSFIAVSSIAKTKQGPKSRFVRDLAPGSVVTTPRTEVQHIVSEYGCVNLQYCDIPTRAKRLISIAHPDFREELAFQAKKAGYLY